MHSLHCGKSMKTRSLEDTHANMHVLCADGAHHDSKFECFVEKHLIEWCLDGCISSVRVRLMGLHV